MILIPRVGKLSYQKKDCLHFVWFYVDSTDSYLVTAYVIFYFSIWGSRIIKNNNKYYNFLLDFRSKSTLKKLGFH